MSTPDIGAINGLIAAAESAVDDEARYTLPNGTPTYDDTRSVRMIVRDKALAKCAGMLGPLLEVYEAARAWRYAIDGRGDQEWQLEMAVDAAEAEK